MLRYMVANGFAIERAFGVESGMHNLVRSDKDMKRMWAQWVL